MLDGEGGTGFREGQSSAWEGGGKTRLSGGWRKSNWWEVEAGTGFGVGGMRRDRLKF